MQYRIAVGSFLEQYSNKVSIVRYSPETNSFNCTGSFSHPYPATKVAWVPDDSGTKEDLLATTGDYLRVWRVSSGLGAGDEVAKVCEFTSKQPASTYCSPLTSMDWNRYDPTCIGTSSIDKTCTIWNVETQQAKTQLVAHDDEVYDIAFSSADVFATAGRDGSIRMFDLRALEHSTITYESKKPMLRVNWNLQDTNFLAAVEEDALYTTIIDVRLPSHPVSKLLNGGHTAAVSAIAWAPHSSCHLVSCGDDSQALIWNLQQQQSQQEPILAYQAQSEINNVKWSTANHEWISIAFDKRVEFLRV